MMHRQSRPGRKLALRKQTLRQLTSLPADALRRVAGGTVVDETYGGGMTIYVFDTDDWTVVDKNGRSATGSVLCRGEDR